MLLTNPMINGILVIHIHRILNLSVNYDVDNNPSEVEIREKAVMNTAGLINGKLKVEDNDQQLIFQNNR